MIIRTSWGITPLNCIEQWDQHILSNILFVQHLMAGPQLGPTLDTKPSWHSRLTVVICRLQLALLGIYPGAGQLPCHAGHYPVMTLVTLAPVTMATDIKSQCSCKTFQSTKFAYIHPYIDPHSWSIFGEIIFVFHWDSCHAKHECLRERSLLYCLEYSDLNRNTNFFSNENMFL